MQISVLSVAAFLVSFCLFTTAQATLCKCPPRPLHGRHSGKVGEYYRRGQEVSFSCDKGFRLVGESRITCVYKWKENSLQWSEDTPECAGECVNSLWLCSSTTTVLHTVKNITLLFFFSLPLYLLYFIRLSSYSSFFFIHRSAYHLEDDDGDKKSSSGSKLQSSSNSESSSSNFFSDKSDDDSGDVKSISRSNLELKSDASSNRHGCPLLPSPSNGEVRVQGYYRPDSVAKYSCQDGYKLSASVYRRCLHDFSWTGEEPKCMKYGYFIYPSCREGRKE